MKKTVILMLWMLLVALPITAAGGQWTGNINGFIGSKTLDEDEWDPLDQHGELGVRLDFAPTANFPVNFVIDLYASGTNEAYSDTRFGGFADVDAATSEFAIGFRKYMPVHKTTIIPYVGAGVVSIAAKIEADDGVLTYEDDDSGGGLWLEGGVVWTVKHLNLGVGIRYSEAEATLFGEDLEIGGFHAGLIAGYHW